MYEMKQWLEGFVFYYPFIMSILWIVGSIYFFCRRELQVKTEAPNLAEYPFVSVLIPARNEQDAIRSTVTSALTSNYPQFEVIVIDDASTDRTPEILQEMAAQYSQLRVIVLKENVGKPSALRYGTLATNGEIIVTIDGDAYLDPNSMGWMVSHFIDGPRVGAVTGNPRVRNRTSMLAKIQVGEYSTIIGMIKRTQRILGKVLTVSGVIAAFRKRALVDVGLWDVDMITDDINMTWKLEKRFWDIRYEPNALCWILVPESICGLWKQRVRWAEGGVQVIKRHRGIWKQWKQRRLWPIYLEYVISVFWSYVYVMCGLFMFALSFLFPITTLVLVYPPGWKGAMLAAIFLLQSFIGLMIDYRYDKKVVWYHYWVVFYPFLYWVLSALAVVWATPKALFGNMGAPAVWTSPDRGLFTKTE